MSQSQPLNVVQEKVKREQGASLKGSLSSAQPLPPPKVPAQVDLFGDLPEPPVRPSTTDTPVSRPPPKDPVPPKQTKASDSLLGLDFFGGPSTTGPGRPSSTASTPTGSTGPSRPDLKQSILSLYASAPKPQPQPQQPAPQHERQSSFGGLQSPPSQGGSFGGLDDAFSNLNFASASSPPPPKIQSQPKSDPFGDFNTTVTQRSTAAPPQVTSPLSGGGFFDTEPKPAPKTVTQPKPAPAAQIDLSPMSSNDLQGFSFASTASALPPKATPSSASNDLFNMSDPSPPPVTQKPPPPPAPTPSSNVNSAFNLSNPTPASKPPSKPTVSHTPAKSQNTSSFSNSDPWGNDNAWAAPEPATAPVPPPPKPAAPAKPPSIPMSSDFSAWGGGGGGAASSNPTSSFDGGSSAPPSSAPKVAPDEDFGGWSSAPPAAPTPHNPPSQAKPSGGGFGGSDDLFSNVWE